MCVHMFIYLIVYAICRYTYKKSHKYEREGAWEWFRKREGRSEMIIF